MYLGQEVDVKIIEDLLETIKIILVEVLGTMLLVLGLDSGLTFLDKLDLTLVMLLIRIQVS